MAPRPTSRRAPARAEGLLAELLGAPDREAIPFARPVVSWSDQDEDEYLAAIEACALDTFALARRGREHGDWAELDPRRAPVRRAAPPARGTRAFDAACAARWHAARPIVLPGIAGELLDGFAPEIRAAAALHEDLGVAGGLARLLAARTAALEPEFAVRARRAGVFDPERDVERVELEALDVPGPARVQDLWLKSSWLSTHDDDSSLRLRVSFGREREDDASRDLLRHRLVADLAARVLPESAVVTANPPLVQLVERLCGEPLLFTQHIAYWNAPQGGALFHHDAFVEDEADGGACRQLGVCYVQLSGATAWLALSTGDLAERVVEFAEALEEGQLPWVRAQLFESGPGAFPGGWRRFRALVDARERLVAEIGMPGCGRLGPLVNRGPEFTAFLADAGHACILRAGDAILLPNAGLRSTCMHSVFCAGDEVAYSLSLAIRPDRAPPEARLEAEARRYARVEKGRAAAEARRARRRDARAQRRETGTRERGAGTRERGAGTRERGAGRR